MSVCPFCKKTSPGATCPSCGRGASIEAPSGTDWTDDDDLGGGLDLSRGGSFATHAAGPSAYSGGGLAFGDDDPFADDVSAANALELDLAPSHAARSPRSIAPAAEQPISVAGDGDHGVPDLVLPRPTPSTSSLRAVVPAPAPAMPVEVAPPPPPSQPLLGAPAPSAPRNDRSEQLGGEQPIRQASDPSLPPQSQPHSPAVASPAAPPSRDPAALIARYPNPPAKIWETPAYAMKVLWRQLELRQDLASLRKRRSPDVPLYERALRTYDPKTFTLGLVLTCAAVTIAMFVFFLPVILRFVRDPS